MWYDAVVIAILLFATIRGAMRGVIWQLAGLAGLVVCVVFAESISAAVSPFVGLPEPLNEWVVMFVAYLVFSFFAFGVARLMHEAIEKAELKEYNRHLGALFGFIKGVAICLVLTFFIVTVSDSAREALKHSTSGRYAAIIMDRLHPVMPEKLHDALWKYIHLLDDPSLDLKYADHDHDHDHGEGADDHDHGPQSPDPFANSGGTIDTTAGAGTGVFEQILGTIPGLISHPEVRGVVEQALRNTSTENRGELLARLRTASPTQLRQIAIDWLDQPAPGGPAEGAGGQTMSQLLQDIADVYAQTPADRTRVIQQIQEQLRGLPDQVTAGVLVDWRADVSGGQQADPDPQTTAKTTIDQRIIRQLTIQRVSVWTLGDALQKRLSEAVQR